SITNTTTDINTTRTGTFWTPTTTTTTTTTTSQQSDFIDVQAINNRTRTGIRTSLVPGGLQTQSLGNRVVQVA
mgnify:CR=1